MGIFDRIGDDAMLIEKDDKLKAARKEAQKRHDQLQEEIDRKKDEQKKREKEIENAQADLDRKKNSLF